MASSESPQIGKPQEARGTVGTAQVQAAQARALPATLRHHTAPGIGSRALAHSLGFPGLKNDVREILQNYLGAGEPGTCFCNSSSENKVSSVIREASQCSSKFCLCVLSTHKEPRGHPLDRRLRDSGMWAADFISSPGERSRLRKKEEEMGWEQLATVSLRD